MSEILVKATRGGHEESFPRGSIPVVDRRGKIWDSVGDPDFSNFLTPRAKTGKERPFINSSEAIRGYLAKPR